MEYILYIMLVFTGDQGVRVDSQRFDSAAACDAAAATVRETVMEQAARFPGEVNRFNIQLRCIAAGEITVNEE